MLRATLFSHRFSTKETMIMKLLLLAFIVCAAVLACVGMVWWMRPRDKHTAAEGDHHVGILGF